MRIFKMAQSEKDIPKPDVLATYVEALKMYYRDNAIHDMQLNRLVETLPSPTKIHKDFSFEECKILFETVNYLWKKLVGKDIIDETKLFKKPESLFGTFWLIENGILLQGINHYSIVKQNTNMFSTLLGLNGFALQQYLASPPNDLIRYILENGGIRMFINKNKKGYFQMSSDTYGKWGKSKVKKYDLREKIIKIIDFNVPYRGWKSGITIRI